MNTLLYLSILLLGGLLCGRLVKQIRLPNVTGYLIAGLILGPFVLRVVPLRVISSFDIISKIALSFIAFTIGCEFKLSYFKRVGLTPIIIALCEAMGAVFIVQAVLIIFGFNVPFSIILGSIAAATAPAATIMVIKQYKAKGPVTETLMSVVALDDAVALIAFGFAVTIAKAIAGGGQNMAFVSVLKPFGEILLALAVGGIVGLLFKIPLKFFKKTGNRLIILSGLVFLTGGIAEILRVSELLACMAAGMVFSNISSESEDIARLSDLITPPIFLLFFTVSGAALNLSLIPSIGLAGILYVFFRVVGKIGGAYLAARVMKAPAAIRRYLGPTLIPQAGVAIGLATVSQTIVPEYAAELRTIVLCATLIYEIIGPAITKISLTKAGEIANKSKVPKTTAN
ncbi:MAG: cation:proton antiporter [Clostridiales bacterium]|nr:cation:proton antiporter [Clostridiales bacterium]